MVAKQLKRQTYVREKLKFQNINTNVFRLFPIISISQIFFLIFFLTLGKIGIDEKVIC